MKKEKSCGAVVFREDEKKYLIIHQVKGHFSFPKGHIEKKETEKKTAIREVKEETGIDIVIEREEKYSITYSPKENVVKDVFYFIARPLNYDFFPQEEEVIDCMWLTYDEAYKKITYDDDKKILMWAKNIIEK